MTERKTDQEARNKYELVMVASREARRLNELARASGKELKRRITEVALERLNDGKIEFVYTDEPFAPKDDTIEEGAS